MTVELFLLIVVFVCLLTSAFFSASETAFTASSRSSMHRLEKHGSLQARIILRLLGKRERTIGALLLGNNVVNIASASIATSLLTAWFGDVGVLYATAVMTVIVVIFCEVMPKTAAIYAPDRFTLAVASILQFLVFVFSPFLTAIDFVARNIFRLIGFKLDASQQLLPAHEHLRGTVDMLHSEGGVAKQDRDMFGGLLDLKELQVSDVMVHRTEMAMINADDPPEEIVRQVLASQFTRIPLWREKPENIVGVLHAKDLLRALQQADGEPDKVDPMAIALKPWFVPDMRPLAEQLKAFRRRKTHFALVVDEYGEVEGLVTLEDILEEIVGDISDEHDVTIEGVRPQPDGSVVVEGSVPIRDLNRALDWHLPDDEATTIAGLVIHEARLIPEPGQGFTFHGFRFRVLRRERNRITALRITPLNARPAPAGAA